MDRNRVQPTPIKLSWSKTTAKSKLEKLEPETRKLVEDCAAAFLGELKTTETK